MDEKHLDSEERSRPSAGDEKKSERHILNRSREGPSKSDGYYSEAFDVNSMVSASAQVFRIVLK